MINWRLAESLKQLRRQLDTVYPNRSKISDGAIGDAAHASRASDHNPWVKDKNGTGVVTGIDITHDTKKGIDCRKILKSLLSSGDSRIKYIIIRPLYLQLDSRLCSESLSRSERPPASSAHFRLNRRKIFRLD